MTHTTDTTPRTLASLLAQVPAIHHAGIIRETLGVGARVQHRTTQQQRIETASLQVDGSANDRAAQIAALKAIIDAHLLPVTVRLAHVGSRVIIGGQETAQITPDVYTIDWRGPVRRRI